MRESLVDLVNEVNAESPFLPPNINVNEYIGKLLQYAVILPIIEENRVKAFIAFYCNDTVNKKSYFSILVLSADLRAKKMGSLLMETAIAFVKRNAFEAVETQVYKDNISSFKMCEKLGFHIKEDLGDSYILMKSLI